MSERSRQSRRRFLKDVVRGTVAAVPAFTLSENLFAHQPPQQKTGLYAGDPRYRRPADQTKSLVSEADFQYVGAFRLPRDVEGRDGAWGRGLAIRELNGQPRIISSTVDGTIYEALPPEPGTHGEFPQASIVTVWGDLSKGHRVGQLNGLFWDEPTRRLYWSSGDLYNTIHPDNPSMGFSTFNDQAGTPGATYGPWRFTGRGSKATMGGVLALPDWFAAQYTAGRRLAAGFGGYWSIVANGPAHMGPALCAFETPDVNLPAGKPVKFTNLVGYPFNPVPYTQPDRCHRDTDYRTEFDGWNPRNGVGYWSWTDFLWQGAVWIDLPQKHGVVFMPTLGRGRTWYEGSTLHAERAAHAFYVYDPMEFVPVASGKTKQWRIQPAQTWDMQFENITYPMPGWRDEPNRMITGATFDQSRQTLYVAVRFAYGTGAAGQHLVYVYRVK